MKDDRPLENPAEFRSRRRAQLFWTLGFLILVSLASRFLHYQYERTIPPRTSSMQQSYPLFDEISSEIRQLGLNHQPSFWAEPGRGGAIDSVRISSPEYSLSFKKFRPGPSWSRAVSWHAFTKDSGTITVHGPAGRMAALAVYLTDGDGHWRSSVVSSSGRRLLASELHDGKWLLLPLIPAQKNAGKAIVAFRRLSGATVAVSAVAAFEAPFEQ